MRIPLIVFSVLAFLFISCSRPSPENRALDDVSDLSGYFNGAEKKLYVREGSQQDLLNKIAAKPLRTEGSYEAVIRDQRYEFSLVVTKTPFIFSPDFYSDSLRPGSMHAKFYLNAECGQLHPGFVSPCMGTFGPHRAFGRSMIWQVTPWKDCIKGSNLCVEWYKQVGTITYYPDANCADTMFVTQPIMRFRCD